MTENNAKSHAEKNAASRGEATVTLDGNIESPRPFPRQVGRYRLKRIIGSGGMGTVYEALQEQPRRTVALKLMRSGFASTSALRRFEYESQVLGRLRHPAIAQIFEAGRHEEGGTSVPYFAMEYVPGGKNIKQHANSEMLSVRERLQLFMSVCEAVHHGHQNGVIHRDLKPANILVDSTGQVKVIDFGVARSTESDVALTTLQTDIGQLIGTLQYMSPEQCIADPNEIDTRTDIYSLGVVLYELLTDHLPYDLHKKAIHEATRVIRESPPIRPSTLNRTIRGDIETITFKALEKEKQRRYQSAQALCEDLAHYLAHEPIMARPPSVFYKAKKLIRRRRVPCAVALVILVVAGFALDRQIRSTWAAARHSTIENAYAVFYAAQPDGDFYENRPRIIQECTRAIELAPDFAMAYALRGRAYWWQDRHDVAWRDCKKALSLEPENALAHRTLGHLFLKKGELDSARDSFARGFEKFLTNEDLPRDMHNRARVHALLGDYDNAKRFHNAALALKESGRGYLSRSFLLRFTGDFDGAVRDLHSAFELESKWAAQGQLWLWEAYLLRGEAGDSKAAEAALSEAKAAATTPFERAVIDMIKNATDETRVMELARSKEFQCCAYYYRGAKALVKGQTQDATKFFELSLKSNAHEVPEYQIAQWHLTSAMRD